MCRIVAKIFLILIASLCISIGILNILEQRSYSGTLLHEHDKYGRVEITRDEYGIPHIKAKTLVAVTFG